jgi:endogenous inhibitor of DNA gyrase (YacG/DUF329 family)
MFMLTIRCPRTGQAVSTGLYTDPDSFRMIPEVLVVTNCPRCGLHHTWRPDEAWLAGDPPPSRSLRR